MKIVTVPTVLFLWAIGRGEVLQFDRFAMVLVLVLARGDGGGVGV